MTVGDFGQFLGRRFAHRGLDRAPAGQVQRGHGRCGSRLCVLVLPLHHYNGVETASRLYQRVLSRSRAYKPMLEHLARRRGERSVVPVVDRFVLTLIGPRRRVSRGSITCQP